MIIGNALHKRSITDKKKRGWIFGIILIIICSAFYSGVYSVSNFYFNWLYENNDLWRNHDKLIGHFSVRITALILLWSVLSFTIRIVFGNNLTFFIKQTVTMHSPSEFELFRHQRKNYDLTSYYNRYYFSQIGFYILNVLVAEILIVTGDGLAWLALFFAFLPIMVDDYLVIHYYFEKFDHMAPYHKRKKFIFNFLLFVISIVSLLAMGSILLLIVYFSVSIIMIYLRLTNSTK